MNGTTVLLLVFGLALLVLGAEVLVRGSSRLAADLGVSPLIIGLTVVAFGTGSPELAVGVRSALEGQTDIALGNVVGSNIFNILFILGASAAVAPLIVAQQLVRLDVPIMILASGLLYVVAANGRIGNAESVLLVIGLLLYTVLLWRLSRRNARSERAQRIERGDPEPGRSALRTLVNLGLIAAGLALLGLGSRWLVDSASELAAALGVSQLVIGLTVVAAGTSLPEAATSIIAGLRGERDIAVGNVVGSNVFNILGVIGVVGLLSPGGLVVAEAAVNFDIPVMLGVAVACLPIFFADYLIKRWQGIAFLCYWAAYTGYVVLLASRHDALPEYSLIMSAFVLPLTLFTVVLITVRGARRRAAERRS